MIMIKTTTTFLLLFCLALSVNSAPSNQEGLDLAEAQEIEKTPEVQAVNEEEESNADESSEEESDDIPPTYDELEDYEDDEEPPEGSEPQEAFEEDDFKPKFECEDHHNCTEYEFCFSSYWLGRTCNTNFKKEDYRSAIYCLGLSDEGDEFPVHSHCAAMEAEAWGYEDPVYSTSRCIPQLGYTCAKAYYNPCTPNYNEETGEPIEGEEESCPTNFECVDQEYKSDEEESESGETSTVTRKVCVPIKPKDPFSSECETRFDCGYSVLGDEWPSCVDGRCIRAIEKK